MLNLVVRKETARVYKVKKPLLISHLHFLVRGVTNVELITRLPVRASCLFCFLKPSLIMVDSDLCTTLAQSAVQLMAGHIITAIPSHSAHTLPRLIFNLNYFRHLLNELLATKIEFCTRGALPA
jgi:hypothetical protein